MVWVAVVLGALLGGLIQSITGFGAAVVLMTILPHFFSMLVAPSISTAICLALSGMISWKLRKRAKMSIVLLPTVCYNLASVTMIQLVGGIDLSVLTIAFGAFLILLGGYFLLFARDKNMKLSIPLAIIFSLLAGVCGGLFSVGGPFLAIYFLTVTDDHEEYLANIQTEFFFGNIFNITARIMKGYFTTDLIPFALLGIGGVLCGQQFGRKLGGKLNAEKLRAIVYGYVVLSGVITIMQQVLK